MKNKKNIVTIIIFIILIISTIFYFFYKNDYRTIKFGNNITKSAETIKEYILNISSYEAKISVEIKSNKNSNKYLMYQQFQSPNIFKQEILEPSTIQGLKTIYDGTNLKLENTKLNLSEIYENYKYISENSLYLNSFIKEYKQNNNSKYNEENNEIVMETKIENSKNKYVVYKKLYINKETAKPIKLEVKDINQNMLVYILYNEIKFDSTSKEEILAFKLKAVNSNV